MQQDIRLVFVVLPLHRHTKTPIQTVTSLAEHQAGQHIRDRVVRKRKLKKQACG